MPDVVERLERAGLLVESDGAEVVFPPGFTNREGEPLPLIVRSSAGGFNYATSDLACVLDRVERLDADLLLYVVDAGQSQHFADGVRRGARWRDWLTSRRPTRSTSRSASCSAPTARCLKQPQWRFREAHRAARRSGRASDRGRRREEPRPHRPTSSADGRRSRSASVRSSTPTCRPTASRTTSSTGIGCSRSRATRRRTCSTRTPGSARSSAAPRSNRAAVRSATIVLGTPQERALAQRVLALPTRARRHARPATARTGCAPTCSTSPGLHRVLRALSRAEASTSRCARAGWRSATWSPGRSPTASGCSASKRPSRCDAGTLGSERARPPTASRHRRRRRRRVADDRWVLGRATLVGEFGTPLFVYDEAHLRARCREAVAAFGHERAVYATKAFLCRAMARLAHEEGMLLDVASGGELHVALSAGVPASSCVMHGNNKSVDELREAIAAGVRHIVVDSFDELDRLDALHAERAGPAPDVLAAHHARGARPHPRVHRHRSGRLEVRVQPRQRRCRAGRRAGDRRPTASTSSGSTATSARTCSRRRASPRPPR